MSETQNLMWVLLSIIVFTTANAVKQTFNTLQLPAWNDRDRKLFQGYFVLFLEINLHRNFKVNIQLKTICCRKSKSCFKLNIKL